MISRNLIVLAAMLGAIVLVDTSVMGQAAPWKPSTYGAGRPKTEAEYIHQQLKGTDVDVRKALERINILVDAGVRMPIIWTAALYEKAHHEDICALGTKGIVNAADATKLVQETQRYRVRSLIELGKSDEALAAAKAYYNVASLKETENAVKFVARALAMKDAEDLSIQKRFKNQQIEWSMVATVPPASEELGENVLKTIKVTPEPFAAAADAISARDYDNSMAKGNLLLLADRPAEARKAFEVAEMSAESGDQTTVAIEGIARAIRAETGALGPANAFIVSRQSEK